MDENSKYIFEFLRNASYFNYQDNLFFRKSPYNVKGFEHRWISSNLFAFLKTFKGLPESDLHIMITHALSRSLHDQRILQERYMPPDFAEEVRNYEFDIKYGPVKDANKFDITGLKDVTGKPTSIEGFATSDLYHVTKSLFYMRYLASLFRAQSSAKKALVRECLDDLSSEIPTFMEGFDLFDKDDKKVVQSLFSTKVPGFRKKYGRRDVSIKEYFDV